MAIDDPVQPDEGQGGESGDSPYADYLNRIPENVRGDVEPIFKEWDQNTTRKFQEAAEYRNSWKPYEELGVNQQDPDAVKWALEVANFATQDPVAFQQWVTNGEYAEQHGLTRQEQQDVEQEYVDPSVEQLVQARLEQQLGPVAGQLAAIEEWRAAQEQQQAEQQAMARIEQELEQLKTDHPDSFDRDKIEMFIPRHMESDPEHAVALAFQDWQAVFSQVEKQVLEGKVAQPTGAVSGGSADGSVESPNSFEQAREMAKQMLRANNA